MDSYIIRIYRRDNKNQPLAGTIEPVGNHLNSLQTNSFNDREKLWALLSVPVKSDSKINQTKRE